MRAVQVFGTLVMVCCSVAMQGCTNTLQSSTIPPLEIGSPLRGVPPRTFVIREFKDTRGVDPRLLVQEGGKSLVMDKPVAAVVAESIQRELERNGHKCVSDGAQPSADYEIEGTVYKYSLSPEVGIFKAKDTASVGVKVVVTGLGSHKGALMKNYEGSYQLSSGVGGLPVREILNQALLNMLKEMSTDQQFVEAIQK